MRTVRLTTSSDQQVASAVLADDRLVLVDRNGINDNIGVWTKEKPEFAPLINSAAAERNPDLLPDGKWLAYESLETTPSQIYVQPFPDVNGGKWQISKDGGVRPVWSRNGRELYFLSSAAGTTVSLYAVAMPTTPKDAGNPVKLFDVANLQGQQNGRFYVVANWFEELRAKVGGK